MTNDNDIRQGIHCIFLMHGHSVFLTEYRRQMFANAILDSLRSYFIGKYGAVPIKIIHQCIEQQQMPH